MSINSLIFDATTTTAVTVNNQPITLAASSGKTLIVSSGAGNHIISAGFILGTNQSWNIAAGTTLTVTGAISGSGALGMASGTGTLILSNSSNSYSGGTTISAGTLKNGLANALPTGTTLTVNGTGTFDLNGFAQTVGSLADGGVITGVVTDSGGAATLTVNNSGSNTFSGTISGTNLSLAKTGAGTLTLSGNNTYGGGTTVSAGTVALSSNTALGTGAATLAGGTLTLLPAVNLSGFGGGGTGWWVNSYNIGGTAITNNILTLTDGGGSESRSAFYTTKQNIAAPFTVNFTYTAAGNKAADGATFCIQNDSRGITAMGQNGGSLAYGTTTGQNIAQSCRGAEPLCQQRRRHRHGLGHQWRDWHLHQPQPGKYRERQPYQLHHHL